jgi:hypothetical protein
MPSDLASSTTFVEYITMPPTLVAGDRTSHPASPAVKLRNADTEKLPGAILGTGESPL